MKAKLRPFVRGMGNILFILPSEMDLRQRKRIVERSTHTITGAWSSVGGFLKGALTGVQRKQQRA